jgi:hypothetical protein
MSVGFACKSVRVMDREPALVVNVAEALTGPPVLAPAGVTNVAVLAWATDTFTITPTSAVMIRDGALIFCPSWTTA